MAQAGHSALLALSARCPWRSHHHSPRPARSPLAALCRAPATLAPTKKNPKNTPPKKTQKNAPNSQCGDCTPHNRTHPLKPKPAPAGSAAGADTGPCSGCIYCDKLECAQCGACNAKLIAARFAKKATTTTAAPLPLLKAEAATQPAPRGAPTLLFLAGCAVGAALLGAAYVARSVSARIGAAKSADQYSAHVETGADGEGGVKRSLIGGGE